MGPGWPIGFMAKKKKKKLAYRSLKRINYRQDLWRSEVENLKDQGMIAQIKNKNKNKKTRSRTCKNTKYTMKGSSNIKKIKL